MTAVPASPVKLVPVYEQDQAKLDELGITTYDAPILMDVDILSEKTSTLIQTRSEPHDAEYVEDLRRVPAAKLPAIVVYMDDAGNYVIISGMHRYWRARAEGEAQIKAILLRGEYTGLRYDDAKIVEVAGKFNGEHGKGERDKEFRYARAMWLITNCGYSVAAAAKDTKLVEQTLQARIKVAKLKKQADLLGINPKLSLPTPALKEIVKLKDKEVIAAVCKIPVRGVAAEGIDFPYIVGRVLQHTDKPNRMLEVERLHMHYTKMHSPLDDGIVAVAGEDTLNGKPRPDSAADVQRKAQDAAGRELDKINKHAKPLSVLPLAEILRVPGARKGTRDNTRSLLIELRNNIQAALDEVSA